MLCLIIDIKGVKNMLNAVKRALIVILGVILQFGFAIVIRLFFYKYLGKYKTFKWFAMGNIDFDMSNIWNNLINYFRQKLF